MLSFSSNFERRHKLSPPINVQRNSKPPQQLRHRSGCLRYPNENPPPSMNMEMDPRSVREPGSGRTQTQSDMCLPIVSPSHQTREGSGDLGRGCSFLKQPPKCATDGAWSISPLASPAGLFGQVARAPLSPDPWRTFPGHKTEVLPTRPLLPENCLVATTRIGRGSLRLPVPNLVLLKCGAYQTQRNQPPTDQRFFAHANPITDHLRRTHSNDMGVSFHVGHCSSSRKTLFPSHENAFSSSTCQFVPMPTG